jgi:hypothetical protein
MKQSVKSGHTRDQELMTLSAIAYSPFSSKTALQARLDQAAVLNHSFAAIWWARSLDNVLFIVKDKVAEEYAVVFGGPHFKFGLSFLFDLFENLDIAHQIPMPYPRLGEAKISAGILETIAEFDTLTFDGRTVAGLLNDISARTRVYVTGHSIGGAVATAYSAKLACNNLPELDIIPCVFGAPCAGNKAFADLFDKDRAGYLFAGSARYINRLDMIPYLWNNLSEISLLDFKNIKCPVEFNQCLECMDKLLILARVAYAQPPAQCQFKGKAEPDFGFYHQLMHQHSPNTYLSLLGLDPVAVPDHSYSDAKTLTLADSL